MKGAYPVIIREEEGTFYVEIPGFDLDTYGESLYDAVEMARDAIGLAGISKEDHGEELPAPLGFEEVKSITNGEVISYIDVDFSKYREELDNVMVPKNCTIPASLKRRADAANINCSEVLREGLEKKLQSLAF